MTQTGLVGGGRLTDWVSLGVLASWVPRDAGDDAIDATGKGEADKAAFAKARVVTIGECASHAVVDAAIGPVRSKGSGEQSLARTLYPHLSEDWLLIADRNFYNWQDWCTAADTGAALLWRGKTRLTLLSLGVFPDGSPPAPPGDPKTRGKARAPLPAPPPAGRELGPRDPPDAHPARVTSP